MGDFEVLEHTADVGLLARGATLEEAFAAATRGMAEIAGAWRPGGGDEVPVSVEATDLDAVLVEWLSDVLYLYDARNATVGDVELDEVTPGAARGRVVLAPFTGDPSEGVQIKAVTFHQLAVEVTDDGCSARVFFDI